MKKKTLLSVLLAIGALTLSACSNNAGTGALIGSMVGAGIGKSTVNHSDERAAIGAVVGGIVGAAIGSEKDKRVSDSYSSETTTVVSNSRVQHTHQYSSGNQTHTHSGGSVQHSHNNPQYVYANNPYPVRSTIVISSGHSRGHRYRPHRYRPHKYRRPHRGHRGHRDWRR